MAAAERWSRRAVCLGAISAAIPASAPGAGAEDAKIYFISRERLLREAAAARRLGTAEADMTALLQRQIDESKARFAEEEAELARMRAELPTEEFDVRVADFDHRIRRARREAQERAQALQKEFQDARARVVAGLAPLIERLRRETGASVIIDAEAVLAADPAADLTDRAIALFDAEGPAPEVPVIDLSEPLFRPAANGDEGAAPSGQ